MNPDPNPKSAKVAKNGPCNVWIQIQILNSYKCDSLLG